MTDETAKRQAELESDDEDEEAIATGRAALFRDKSSSPELPPLKKARDANGTSKATKGDTSQLDDEGTETEASEASTDVFSDSEQLVSFEIAWQGSLSETETPCRAGIDEAPSETCQPR